MINCPNATHATGWARWINSYFQTLVTLGSRTNPYKNFNI